MVSTSAHDACKISEQFTQAPGYTMLTSPSNMKLTEVYKVKNGGVIVIYSGVFSIALNNTTHPQRLLRLTDR